MRRGLVTTFAMPYDKVVYEGEFGTRRCRPAPVAAVAVFIFRKVHFMHTVTKKELVDRISDETDEKRVAVKKVIQQFLDEIIEELGKGNRLEFRDFGVFETKERAARMAQNPKTLQRVHVPPKRTVKFKVGRLMKIKLQEGLEDNRAEEQGEADSSQQAATTPGSSTFPPNA
jgi:integration host factor subunit beta